MEIIKSIDTTMVQFAENVRGWQRIKAKVYPVLRPDGREDGESKEVLSESYLDLKLQYRLIYSLTEDNIAAVKITEPMLEEWGITKELLHRTAIENMERDDYSIRDIFSICREMMGVLGDCDTVDWNTDMYVLTNSRKVEGAAGLLNVELIGKFAEKRRTDLYILPSSTHELILIPDTKLFDPDMLQQIVIEVNDTQVAENEQLGNTVYYYERKSHQIQMT